MLNKQVRSSLLRLDEFVGKWQNLWQGAVSSIYCRKGCSGCCNLAVHASFPEAIAAITAVTSQQLRALSDYIERLRAALPELTDLKSYLHYHRQEIGPCPFLDGGGACGIYADRPLSCRALLSTRPAEWCSVDFAGLDKWDRLAYEAGLDRRVVAWPTHYVAATQEAARIQETDLIVEMKQAFGWSLAGNFPLMVWLAHPDRLGQAGLTGQTAREQLIGLGLNHPSLLELDAT